MTISLGTNVDELADKHRSAVHYGTDRHCVFFSLRLL